MLIGKYTVYGAKGAYEFKPDQIKCSAEGRELFSMDDDDYGFLKVYLVDDAGSFGEVNVLEREEDNFEEWIDATGYYNQIAGCMPGGITVYRAKETRQAKYRYLMLWDDRGEIVAHYLVKDHHVLAGLVSKMKDLCELFDWRPDDCK